MAILAVAVIVECDVCGEEEHLEFDDFKDMYLENAIKEAGWKRAESYVPKLLCVNCASKEDE